jgi:hypothetical protein
MVYEIVGIRRQSLRRPEDCLADCTSLDIHSSIRQMQVIEGWLCRIFFLPDALR